MTTVFAKPNKRTGQNEEKDLNNQIWAHASLIAFNFQYRCHQMTNSSMDFRLSLLFFRKNYSTGTKLNIFSIFCFFYHFEIDDILSLVSSNRSNNSFNRPPSFFDSENAYACMCVLNAIITILVQKHWWSFCDSVWHWTLDIGHNWLIYNSCFMCQFLAAFHFVLFSSILFLSFFSSLLYILQNS